MTITFEEAHGKYPNEDQIESWNEKYPGWQDQFNLCCCQCERCKPSCRCGEI